MNISNLTLKLEYRTEEKNVPFTAPSTVVDGITFTLEQKAETFRLTAKSDAPLGLKTMALEFTYQGAQDFSDAIVYQERCNPNWEAGIKKLNEALPESLCFGIVSGEKSPCFFMGTMIPQNNLQDYQAKSEDAHTLKVTATARFAAGQADQTFLASEWVWISEDQPYLQTLQQWASMQPELSKKEKAPIYGWNTWDYYFETVSHTDIEENIAAIKADPILSQKVKYITVDDGWSHDWGVWEPNYRFPKGMKYTADYIKEQGFIPGIWTAPLKINFECYYGRLYPEMMVQDAYGDAFREGRRYYIDPTSPMGEKYIYDLYKGLYDAGYRFFKTDFIWDITRLTDGYFYRKEMGFYEVIRYMYQTIRSALGDDAKILGCNLPAEVGGDIAEYTRTGLDIHSNWSALKMAVLFLQNAFWMPDHIAAIDGDFMVVRGEETSDDRPVDILRGIPGTKKSIAEGRRFYSVTEAKTWADITAFCGGNRILSDRMAGLNQTGLEILYQGLEFEEHPHYLPLDLGRKSLAEYWYKKTDTAEYLMLVNFEDTPQRMGEGMELPFAIKPRVLEPHASVIIKKGEE